MRASIVFSTRKVVYPGNPTALGFSPGLRSGFCGKPKKLRDQEEIQKILAVSELAIAIPPFVGSKLMKSVGNELDIFGLGLHWVLINKLADFTGYSDDAIRAKKTRGIWKEGVHWRKGPDNRVIFNLVAIQRWMGGNHA